MLRITIQTTDEATGMELAIPDTLRAQVRHVAEYLESQLRKVSRSFDIEARVRVVPRSDLTFAVLLDFVTPYGSITDHAIPASALENHTALLWNLKQPMWDLGKLFSAEVGRMLAELRLTRDELVSVSEN